MTQTHHLVVLDPSAESSVAQRTRALAHAPPCRASTRTPFPSHGPLDLRPEPAPRVGERPGPLACDTTPSMSAIGRARPRERSTCPETLPLDLILSDLALSHGWIRLSPCRGSAPPTTPLAPVNRYRNPPFVHSSLSFSGRCPVPQWLRSASVPCENTRVVCPIGELPSHPPLSLTYSLSLPLWAHSQFPSGYLHDELLQQDRAFQEGGAGRDRAFLLNY